MTTKARTKKMQRFEDFLEELGEREEIELAATKRLLARRAEAVLKTKGITKSSLARHMNTSPAAVDRLLDPSNTGITLATLSNLSNALGMRLVVDLLDQKPAKRTRKSA